MIITWKNAPHALSLINFLFCYVYLVLKICQNGALFPLSGNYFQHFSFLIPWGTPVFTMSPLKKKYSQQPEWLLVSDNTSKEWGGKTNKLSHRDSFLNSPCALLSEGNSRESSRHCCHRTIPPTKGTFSHCCRAIIFTPCSICRKRDLADACLCLQHAGIAPGEQEELVPG